MTEEKKMSGGKKFLLWGGLIAGIIASAFYAISSLNIDLSLSNAARALIDESAKQVLNAPQNVLNKVKEQVPAPAMPNMMNNISPF